MVRISFTLTLGLAALPSVLACTKSTAKDFEEYIVDHLPNIQGPTSGPSSPSSSDPWEGWLGRGHDAVNDVGFKSRRRATASFSCSSSDVCLYQSSFDALLCYNQNLATYKYENGLRMDIASGKYTTPDGEKGDFDSGPCPGKDFEPNEEGSGCTLARISKQGSSSTSDSDSEDTTDSPESTSSSDSTFSPGSTSSPDSTDSGDNSDSGNNSESAAATSGVSFMIAAGMVGLVVMESI